MNGSEFAMSSETLHRFRDVIEAVGPDTVKFLHAIVSQDVAAMVDDEVRWSFLLTPQGRVVSHFRIHRVDGDQLILDVEAGHGESLLASLRKYLIRTKCTLTLTSAVQTAWTKTDLEGEGGRVVPAHPLLGGFDRFYKPELVADSGGAASSFDPTDATGSASSFEEFRVAAGLPVLGAELDEHSIPNGTGLLPWAVNFTKGCYIGQELVERIDSRSGNTPSRLVRLGFAGEVPQTSAADDSEKAPLRVTSVAEVGGSWVGLGWAARSLASGQMVASATIGADVGLPKVEE
jgi:tRNA-modifying protein YgfZ